MTLQTPVKLPYFCNSAGLPGPLPTPDEIQDASRRHGWGSSGGVCVIRGIFLVKYGVKVTENEGNALLFVEEHLNISAPRLYAMYHDPHSKVLHLVMEYIQGVDMESLWKTLSVEAKSSIASQLRPMFTQIRSINPPPDFIGGVCGGGLPDPVFGTMSPDNNINGPFKTDEEFSSALALALRNNWEQNGRYGWLSGYLSRHVPTALKGYRVTLTHGDLHMRNILVEKVPSFSGSSVTGVGEEGTGQHWSYQVKGIVDWESAGWYPAYWEYASAVARFQSEDDWLESLDTIIKPYPQEASIILLVLQGLQFI
ncbi:unnamed protein product [Clonostachys chloroleuca]|uniref:Aminoglycoside phosphotransferase domain-containing protein n=1 Tax=Clonostachys chloroleuca TaxID=1926264 RepID=A0AA35M6Z3_9HYPO|nr:unnamed protein product [Clonostachys chloroleuca]